MADRGKGYMDGCVFTRAKGPGEPHRSQTGHLVPPQVPGTEPNHPETAGGQVKGDDDNGVSLT